MKEIVSSFLPLVLLVTLMQAIPIVFPSLDLNRANASVAAFATNGCTTTATLGSPSGQGVSTACDDNSSSVFVSYDNDVKMRITLSATSVIKALSFTAGGDDQTYRSRMVASATLSRCTSTFSGCVVIGTASWTKSYLDSLNNGDTYAPVQFTNSTSSQYYTLTTSSYGVTFGELASTHACSVASNNYTCIQFADVKLFKPVTVSSFTSVPTSLNYSSTPATASSTFSFNSSDSGTYYLLVYVCVANVCASVTAPSADTVISQPALSSSIAAKATGVAVAGVNSVVVSGLTPGQYYVSFPVVVDQAGIKSDVVTSPGGWQAPYLTSSISSVSPISTVTSVNYTKASSVTVGFTPGGSGVGGASAINVYYSTSSNLSNQVLCGTYSAPTTSGTLTCSLPNYQGYIYLYSEIVDSLGNAEPKPTTQDYLILRDTVSPTVGGSTSATFNEGTFPNNNTSTFTTSEAVYWSISGTDASRFNVNTCGTTAAAASSANCNVALNFGELCTDPLLIAKNFQYTATITATDRAGNTTSVTYNVTISCRRTHVTGIKSISPDGYYGALDVIEIEVSFEDTVTVINNVGEINQYKPQIGFRLCTNSPSTSCGSGIIAYYASGSGTNKLRFTLAIPNTSYYFSNPLDYSSSYTFQCPSTTGRPCAIRDSTGLDVSLYLPPPNLQGGNGTYTGTLDPFLSTSTIRVQNITSTSVSNLTSTSGNIAFNSKTTISPSYFYYLVYTAATAAPTASTVFSQGAAIAKGTGTLVTGLNTLNISGLSPSTSYIAYIVTGTNVSSSLSNVTSVPFTTAGPLPVVPTITKFDVQVKSGNSTLVPDKTLTSLLSANYSPTYSRYQDVAFTVNATTTDAGVLTWQIREGTNCSSTTTVISGSTGLTINTTKTISTWNTSTCYIVEVINTLNGVTSSILSSYQFLPQYTTTPVTVNASTAANNLSGVVGASFSNSTPFSVSGGGGSWQYYLTSAPAGLSINVSTGAITGTFTTVSTGSGAYIRAVDANGGTAYALVGPITWSVTAGSALTPTFGTPTATADGFTVSITNYDPAFTWATPTMSSGSVAVTSTTGSNRVLTVTGLSPGATATITQGTSRTGYTSGSATVSGTSSTGAALTPTFGTPTSTSDGFTVSITNYDPAFTWATPTVGSGSVSVTSTSGSNRVLTVTGLSPGASATITQGTSRTGYTSGSATVSGTSISIPAPTIISFASSNVNTPSSAVFGSTVTITGTNFSNATAVKLGTTSVSSFTVVNTTAITFTVNSASGATYAISVTTEGGTATSSTNLTVTPEVPTISTQPSSATRSVGTSVTFTVVIGSLSETGTVLSYQWKKGSNNISGATSSSYTISSPTVADAGDYSVTISNTSSYTTAVAFLASNAATLTMNTANTSTSFTASSTTPTFGTAVTLTATVTAGATGTVTFKDASNNTLCMTGNLSSGSANCSWTPSSAGDFVVSAVYEGDVNYSTSTSSTTTVTVGKANQSTLTISSLGTSSKSYPYSQALNASTSGGSGNGNVTYAIESGGTATSCTLSSNSATATLTATTAGTCLIKSTKSGGTNYNDAISATATFTFSDVAPGAPTITAITAGFGSLSIAFTAGTNNGTALTNYAYSTDGGATFKNLATPGITSPIVITTLSGSSSSLVAGTTYAVKIRAINTVNGLDSAAVNGTPRNPTIPGTATGDIKVSSSNSLDITIKWSAESNGSAIIKWWLMYGYANSDSPLNYTWVPFARVNPDNDGTYTQSVTMLAGMNYMFTASAENAIGKPSFEGPSIYGAPLSVTYNGQSNTSGSVPVNSTIYLRGGSVTVAGNTGSLARAGYTWGGWTSNSNGTGTVYSGGENYTLGNSNLILYAKWNPNTLTVTYDSKGGSYVNAGSVLTGGSLSAPTAPTRTGYDFAYWSASDGGAALTFPYSPPNTGNFTLYARWTAKSLTVTYDTQGGSSVSSGSTKTGGGIFVSPGIPTRTGYTFNGWYANATGGSALTFPYAHGETGDFTLYAQWSAVTYTITYAKNGATGNLATSSETYSTGGTAISLPGRGTLVKAGHTFAGWSVGGNTPVLSGGYTTTSNVTLSAVWTPISYTITYNPNSGDSTPTQASLTIGQTFTLANAITRAPSSGISYQFAGWDNGTTIFQAGELVTIGTANLSYTAVWVQLYEVTYINNGGTFAGADNKFDTECLSNNLCTNNQAITLNVAPTRAGYEFVGWEDQSGTPVVDTDPGATGIQTTVTSARFIFSANWITVPYTITYVSSGSAAPTQTPLTIGQSFLVGSAVARTGYTFNGYSDGTNTFLPGATYVVGSANITLTALWIADVYTVSYDWNGSTGTATSVSTYTVGSSSDITLPSQGDQVKTNYSFDGWSLTRDGEKLSGSTYVPTTSVTLYARWEINVYTVTYSVQGGTGIPALDTANAGGSVILPRPTRNHYVFLGWYDSSTGGSLVSLADVPYTPSASVTLYARWRQSSLTGFTDAQLTRVLPTAKASSTEDRTFTFTTNGGYGVRVFIPKEALPNNTELGFYLAASPSATARTKISGTINYVLTVLVAWVDPTGDVPDTASGFPIRVTISDTSIKAGAIVYSQIAGQVVELGRATQDGSVTVNITSDPEIFLVKSKPTAPTGVSATDIISGVSTITWSAPSDMGGSELNFYTVTSSGTQVCRTLQTSCTVTGLIDATGYSLTVSATNGVGTSDPASITITAAVSDLDTKKEEQRPLAAANGNLINTIAIPPFSSDVSITGSNALVTWKFSTQIKALVSSRNGESWYEGVARTENGGELSIPNLEAGYQYTITVINDDEKISQVFKRSIAPAKVTRIFGLSPSKATLYAFVVKWQPQSFVEYYKIEITGDGDQPLTYYSKTPDFYLFDKKAKSYLFAISAQGEGGEFSEPMKFRAGLTAPVNISAKLPTNPATNRLTTTTSNKLKSIANRLTAQTVVTVTTYYDPKVKGAKKLAAKRIARTAATLKVTKSTLEVRTQVRPTTSKKSLTQIILTTKAPARKLTLTNV